MQGADVSFQIRGGAGATVAQDALLTVYTTRPDTVRTLSPTCCSTCALHNIEVVTSWEWPSLFPALPWPRIC